MFLMELFPSKQSFFIFNLYMFAFISQGLLVKNSQESFNSYNYNTSLAVLFTELIKLLIILSTYCIKHSLRYFFEQFILHIKLLWLYLIPAFLYCLYNNLSYINLLHYDPATYFILLQLRVVITGILFQIFFRKTLTCIQWSSLIILTLGCMLKYIQFDQSGISSDRNDTVETTEDSRTSSKKEEFSLSLNLALMLIQIVCSCVAGVYCEFLLKMKGVHVDILMQNVFMYADSILFNLFVFAWHWNPDLQTDKLLMDITQPKVMIVILNSAAGGIITSFFLKYLNSIVKAIASALEMVFIAILSRLFFNIPIGFNTALSICMISLAIMLYSRNPVHNPPSNAESKKNSTDV